MLTRNKTRPLRGTPLIALACATEDTPQTDALIFTAGVTCEMAIYRQQSATIE